MRLRQYFFLPLLALLPLAASAQIEDAEDIFRELRALEGVWFMPTDRGDRLEMWRILDDSTMSARGVRIKPENGDTVTLETIRLELRGSHIVYNVTVRGQNNNKPVPFEMTQADEEGYMFENPSHDDPQKIRYRLLGNRELQVFTEGKRSNGRTVTEEYVFEREFAPGSVEFRIRAGANAFTLKGTGNFLADPDPEYSMRPGWELGTQVRFKGRGGFLNLSFELGLVGKFSAAKSGFYGDTLYTRDVTYSQTWLIAAATPEISFKRDARFALVVGPYFGRLLFNRARGEVTPEPTKAYNDDFKKTDFGILAGCQYRLNLTKKDLGGILGIRANLGLGDIDNLYTRGCSNPAFCNGRVGMRGVSLFYSFNLLGI